MSFNIILSLLLSSMVLGIQGQPIEPFSVADDVTNIIKQLTQTITTTTNSALSAFNTYTSQLATFVSSTKSTSLADYSTFITNLNKSVTAYKTSAKNLDIDIADCTDTYNTDVSALTKDQLTIISCIDEQTTTFSTARDNAQAKFQSLSEEIGQLQIEAQVCLNDEYCLLNLKQTCTKIQAYLPLQLQLYSDVVLQEFTNAKAKVGVCSTDNAVGIKGTDILDTIINCVSKKIDAIVGSTTKAPSTTEAPSTIDASTNKYFH